MFNNLSLELEKKAIRNVLERNIFDKDNKEQMEIYKVFEKCAKDDTDSKTMIEELNSLGDLKEYNDNFRNFVEHRIDDLKLLEKQAKEVQELEENVKEEVLELKNNFNERHVDYQNKSIESYDIDKTKDNEDNIFEENKDHTFLEEKDYKARLYADLENLKNINSVLNEEVKKTGDPYDSRIEEKHESEYVGKEHDDEIEKIQTEASNNNNKIFNNASVEDVASYYNDYSKRETYDSKLNIELNFENDEHVEIKLSHRGTKVNESMQSISFVYDGKDNMEYFYNEVYKYLVDAHVIDDNTKTQVNGSTLESENSSGQVFKVSGPGTEALQVQEDIEEAKVIKNGIGEKAKVRKREINVPNNFGFYNYKLFIVILIAVILICLLLIIINIFKI